MQLTFKSSLALAAATLLSSATAHSWIEDMHVIARNGSYIGAPGYPRANAKRGPGVNPDKEMVHLLPPNGRPTGNKILDSDPICMPSQQQPKQSDGSPMLKAAPGDMVALRYQENGHVSLPQNQPGKASNRGTVYIYGTTDPRPDDKFLSIHKVWNPEGTGGDKRGKLLATEPYDDGQCYQVNGGQISAQRQAQFKHQADPIMGQDLWCQNNIKIPSDAPSGKPYTVYWVWDWDTAAGGALPQGLQEKYTTCMDISINQASGQSHAASGVAQFVQGQNINNAAIQKYVEQLNSGSSIYQPGSIPTGNSAGGASSAPMPAPSKPASSTANPLPVPQSSAPKAAGPATVTVTAPAPPQREKTVTVTASAQAASTPQAANGPMTTTTSTNHPTVIVTRPSTMQTQIAPSDAAGVLSAAAQSLASVASTMPKASAAPAQASSKPSAAAAGATPVTVSGVVIPTMSGNRFTGTASPVSPQPTASSNPGSTPAESGHTGYKRCESCKPAKRSVILGGGAKDKSHAAVHVKGRTFRHAGSAKFRF